MIDLDAIRKNSMLKRDGFYDVVGRHRCVRLEDFDALVAEVKRLRAYADSLERSRPYRGRRTPPQGGARIDLDAIRNNSMLKRDGFYHVMGRHRCVPAAGFDALVAEVERLRAYADLLRCSKP